MHGSAEDTRVYHREHRSRRNRKLGHKRARDMKVRDVKQQRKYEKRKNKNIIYNLMNRNI
jgi:hypothetical protein